MVSAILLVSCSIGAANVVASSLRSIRGVTEVYETFGVYDLVIKLKAEDQTGLRELVKTIQTVEGVRSVLTNIVYKKELAADVA